MSGLRAPVVVGLAVLATLAVVGGRAASRVARPQARWLFLHSRLVAPGGLDEALGAMRRAGAGGYNGIVLGEDTLMKAGEPRAEELRAYSAVTSTAKALGLEIVATVFSPGQMLARDPNLAEGLPVRETPFVVSDRVASVVAGNVNHLVNGGFEDSQGDRPVGWTSLMMGARPVQVDSSVRHSGAKSLRFDGSPVAEKRISSLVLTQTVRAEPFRQYHLSAWVRSEDFDSAPGLGVQAIGVGRGELAYPGWKVPRSTDWRQMHVVYDSLESARVEIRFRLWTGTGGHIWLDDVRLEEVGLVNLLRRAGCRLTVRGGRGESYSEGQDYELVAVRPRSQSGGAVVQGTSPEPTARIRLTPSSRIREGSRLAVSYYCWPVTRGSQLTQCLTEPRLDAIMRDQVRRIDALLSPQGYFISHDEMRVINWCSDCRSRGKTPGELLAANVKRACGIIRAVRPGVRIVAWSDMFDPYHNARDKYYFVNGSLAGSWQGLPKDAIIANWNAARKAQSLRWFSDRGFDQIIAGYFDRPVREAGEWRSAAAGVKGVEGFMYTTWVRNYADIGAFARAAWDGEND